MSQTGENPPGQSPGGSLVAGEPLRGKPSGVPSGVPSGGLPWAPVAVWLLVAWGPDAGLEELARLSAWPGAGHSAPGLYFHTLQALLWLPAAALALVLWHRTMPRRRSPGGTIDVGLWPGAGGAWPLVATAALIGCGQAGVVTLAGALYSAGPGLPQGDSAGAALELASAGARLAGLEISRWYLVRAWAGRRPGPARAGLSLAAAWLLCAAVALPIPTYAQVHEPAAAMEALGRTVLPLLAQGLLATYLAYLAGPLAALAYGAPLLACEWLWPVAGALAWTQVAFLGVAWPIVGLWAVQAVAARAGNATTGGEAFGSTTACPQADPAGIATRRPQRPRLDGVLCAKPGRFPADPSWGLRGFGPGVTVPQRQHAAERGGPANSGAGWAMLALAVVALVWLSTGSFGVQPALVSGGSMEPYLQAGDLIVTATAQPSGLRIGDVVRIRRGSSWVVHRVVAIRGGAGGSLARLTIVTQGDANDVADAPVPASQVEGRLVLVVPRLGRVAIWLKQLVQRA